jgi:anthranilate/para-aminobenzoate synthase component II
LPQPFDAGRYHSLVIAPDAVPAGFRVTATAENDQTIMGVRHETQPTFGVQFHPESVLTGVGHQLLKNFLETT